MIDNNNNVKEVLTSIELDTLLQLLSKLKQNTANNDLKRHSQNLFNSVCEDRYTPLDSSKQ